MKSARNEKLNLGEKFDVGTFASALYVILARKGIDANVLFDEKDPSKFKALQNFLNFSNLTSADMDFIVEEVYKTFPDDFKIHTNKIEKSAVLVDMLFVKFNGRIPKHTLSLLVSTVFNQIVKDRKDHSLKTSIEVNDIFNDVLSKFPILFSITYLLSISKVDRSNVYMKWYSLINNNTEDTLLKIEEILLNSGGKSFDKNHLIAFLADYPSNLNDRSLEDFEFYNFSIKLAENIRDVAPKPTQQKLIVDPMKLDFQAETMIADQTHLQRTIVISGDSPDAYQALQGSTLKVAKNPSFIGTVLKVFGIKTKKK